LASPFSAIVCFGRQHKAASEELYAWLYAVSFPVDSDKIEPTPVIKRAIKSVELLPGSWRHDLQQLVKQARSDIFIACPFIRCSEADFICRNLPSGTKVRTLADLSVRNVLSGSLDIKALRKLRAFSKYSEVITLPGLHAKVFIADEKKAIITSGNLTWAGIEKNYEYGVAIGDKKTVTRIREDMERYVSAGTSVGGDKLREIEKTAAPLLQDRKSPPPSRKEQQLRQLLAEAQVGPRTANAIFSDAIRQILGDGVPRTTRTLNKEIKNLLPDLCDDSEYLTVNGESYGKKYKHRVRNAQVNLKRRDMIHYDKEARVWSLRKI